MVVKAAVRSEQSSSSALLLIQCLQMLDTLRNSPEPFEEIIRTHFRLKAKAISDQLDKWLAEDDGKSTTGDGGGYTGAKNEGSSNSEFRKDIQELKKVIKESK